MKTYPPKEVTLHFNGKAYRYRFVGLKQTTSEVKHSRSGFRNFSHKQIASKIANFQQFKKKVIQTPLTHMGVSMINNYAQAIETLPLTKSNFARLQKISAKSTSSIKKQRLILNLLESEAYKMFKANNPSLFQKGNGMNGRRAFNAKKAQIYRELHPSQRTTSDKIHAITRAMDRFSTNSLEKYYFLQVHQIDAISKEYKNAIAAQGFSAIAEKDYETLNNINAKVRSLKEEHAKK